MTCKIVLITALLISSFRPEEGELDKFFMDADSFFGSFVTNGVVNYRAIHLDSSALVSLYRQIGEMNLHAATEPETKAFYINAYNLAVIYWVVKHYPLKSPMDYPGFFDKIKHRVAGQSLTLNDLEKKKLLQNYMDARVHFVLACAAKSCPPLASVAFVPDDLEKQLTDRTVLSVNDPRWLRVDPKKKSVRLNKIFDWYNADFTDGGKTLIAWINQFRTEKIPTTYSIGFYEYDWALNDEK